MVVAVPFYTAAGYKKIAFSQEPAGCPADGVIESDLIGAVTRINATVNKRVCDESDFCSLETLKAALHTIKTVHLAQHRGH